MDVQIEINILNKHIFLNNLFIEFFFYSLAIFIFSSSQISISGIHTFVDKANLLDPPRLTRLILYRNHVKPTMKQQYEFGKIWKRNSRRGVFL